jgi:UDP-glucose 4-epimerase
MIFSVVTGGAGFIGSHLVDALVARGEQVVVIDSLAAGSRDNLAKHLDEGRVTLVQADLLEDGWQQSLAGATRVFHLAADPDVRQSAISPDSQVRNNIMGTYRVLEAMRTHGVGEIAFTSTSTVYGEATVIPTPEDYTPLEPVSVYGASKLASEALISSYCHSFGMKACVYRFANIIGARSGHGVITDFIRKLREDPGVLEILGDGRQSKSYLEVGECVKAMLFAVDHAQAHYNVFNIGSEDWVDVRRIADIVVEEMGLTGVRYRFTGGERGWVGDVPRMQLAVDRIRALGWKPGIGSAESVRSAVRAMLE